MNIGDFLKKECRGSMITLLIVLSRTLYYKLFFGKSIVPHTRVLIKGVKNIKCKGTLKLGLLTTGFVHRSDITFLSVKGKLEIKGSYNIGRGCRIDIGEKGKILINEGGFINASSTMIIMHSLIIGRDCIISWNCQFLDEDFHKIMYEDKKETEEKGIILGDKVWVGCGVYIYQGTVIPEGCVIAANSVVRGVFFKKNCLIAGNPAKIVKENISWSY